MNECSKRKKEKTNIIIVFLGISKGSSLNDVLF